MMLNEWSCPRTPRCASAEARNALFSFAVRSLSSCAYIYASSRRYRPSCGMLAALNFVISVSTSALVTALRLPVAEGVCAATASPLVSMTLAAAGLQSWRKSSATASNRASLSCRNTDARLSYDSSTVSACGMMMGSVVYSLSVKLMSVSLRMVALAGTVERFFVTDDAFPACGMCTTFPALTYSSALTAFERKLLGAKSPSTIDCCQISF